MSDPREEAAKSFVQFLQMIEGGDFHHDISEALRDLNAEMNNHAINQGGTIKGKMSLDFDFSLNDGVFEIKANHKVTHPKSKRGKTIAWSTPGNNFTQINPRQMDMFTVRDVASGESREIRKV